MLTLLLTAASLALGGESPPPVVPPETLGSPKTVFAGTVTAFKASRLYLGDGRILEPGVLIVNDGIITRVGGDLEIPSGAALIEHEGCITPGLIALHSTDGVGAELSDTTRVALPDADASHAFQPLDHDCARARAAGITALVLAPSITSLVGGQSTVVKTHGGTIVKRGAHLALGLSSDALNSGRFPTSYDGALGELKRLFSDPEGPIARAVAGNLPVLMAVNTRAETRRALRFAAEFQLKGALYGSTWAEDLSLEIGESGLAVICDPFDVGDSARSVRAVLALAKAGVPFGFGLDAPGRHPDCLRFGAALCVRAGLDPQVARRALTSDAASIAGVAGRIGRLARGLDADLVLWSADPIQLTSSVEAVYIDGQRVTQH